MRGAVLRLCVGSLTQVRYTQYAIREWKKTKKKKYTIRFEPSGLKTEVAGGTILLDAAHKAGIYLSSICGGDGYCGKCKVIIDQGQFQARPTTLLTPDETRENMVLACQTRILSDMIVTVPKFHALETSQILMDADTRRFSELAGEVQAGIFPFDPLVQKLYLEMTPPTVQDHTADHERLYLAIREKIDAPIMQTGFRILQKIPRVLQDSGYKATVLLAGEAEPPKSSRSSRAITVPEILPSPSIWVQPLSWRTWSI